MSSTLRHLCMFAALTAGSSVPSAIAVADTAPDYYGTAVGFTLGGGNGTFDTGVTVTTPWFFRNGMALRLEAAQSWYTHGYDEEKQQEEWVSNSSYKLGLLGGSMTVNGFMRMYGIGGMIVLVPNDKLTDKKTITGGFGGFGFEFVSGRDLNFYIELGSNGVSARADKLPGKPLYSNGFSSNVGFRYYL